MSRVPVIRALSYVAALLFLFGISPRVSNAQTCTTFVTVSPVNVIFGPQAVSTTSQAQTVTVSAITGCSSATVTLNNFSVTGDFGASGNGASPCAVGGTTTLNVTNAAAATCTVGSTFTPTAAGTRLGSLSFAESINAGAPTTRTVNLIGGDEVVFVSTQYGGQILKVDGITPGYVQVVYDGSPHGTDLNSGEGFYPEGLTVGPDNRLYIADPFYSDIWRMNADGTDIQPVYAKFGSTSFPSFPNCSGMFEVGCPEAPQGPSFSGGPSFIANSGHGDLYFSSALLNEEGAFTMPNVASTPDAGLASLALPPANVIPGTCDTCGGVIPVSGEATAFDATGNLLVADNEDNDVITLGPPYNSTNSTPPTVLVNTGGEPWGLALNKATGQMFVSDTSSNNIYSIGSGGTKSLYYPFTTSTSCPGNDGLQADRPTFMQFDATGRLFTVTTTSVLANGGNACGKVWRIDPGESPTATLLVDLNTALTNGITNGDTTICTAPCGLESSQAIGLAMPPTVGPSQSFPLSSAGGTFTAGWPIGCAPTLTPPNNCDSTFAITYPANMFSNGDTANVTFNEVSQVDYSSRVAGTIFSKTTLAPVAGYNGDGIIPSAVCMNGLTACSDTVTAGTPYQIFTTWQSNQTGTGPSNGYCSFLPHLLRGEPIGGPYTELLVDTLTNCTDGSVGTKGQSSCTTTTSSSCLSDWPNAFGPLTNLTFIGFASPISNSPTLNIAKAGQAIPIVFQVLDQNRNPVTNLTMPPVSIVFAPAPCNTFDTTGDTTITATAAGGSGFQNLGGGNYQFNWKTAKSQASTCGQLQVNLGDGVLHTADFKFK